MIIFDLSYLEEISETPRVVGGLTTQKTVIAEDRKTTPDGSVIAYSQSKATTLVTDYPEVAKSILGDILIL
jgi:outer membrane receptor for monomeric catechols